MSECRATIARTRDPESDRGGGAQLTCESAQDGVTAGWVKERLAWVDERGNKTIKGNSGGL